MPTWPRAGTATVSAAERFVRENSAAGSEPALAVTMHGPPGIPFAVAVTEAAGPAVMLKAPETSDVRPAHAAVNCLEPARSIERSLKVARPEAFVIWLVVPERTPEVDRLTDTRVDDAESGDGGVAGDGGRRRRECDDGNRRSASSVPARGFTGSVGDGGSLRVRHGARVSLAEDPGLPGTPKGRCVQRLKSRRSPTLTREVSRPLTG